MQEYLHALASVLVSQRFDFWQASSIVAGNDTGKILLLNRLNTQPLWQRNLFAISLAQVLTILAFQASIILIPYYVQQMGMTDQAQVATWTGMYQSLGGIGFAIFTPIWGVLGDRYGRRPMLLRAMCGTCVMLFLMGLAGTPSQLLILRAIQGCVTGTPAAAAALLATGSPKHRLAYALGLQQTALFVGSSLGPMFGGLIADTYTYRSTFVVSSALVLIAMVPVLVLVREPEETAANVVQARQQSALGGFRRLLRSPTMVILIATSLAVNLTFGLLGPVMPLFIQSLVADQDRLATTAGTVTGISAIAAAVSALVVGRMSDRIGNRRALIGCSLGGAVLYIPQALARSVWQLGGALTLQGLFRGGIGPNISAMVVQSTPKEQAGSALGLSSSAGSVGFAVGPLLGAAILAGSSARTVFWVAAALFAAVGLSTLMVNTRAERAAKLAPEVGPEV